MLTLLVMAVMLGSGGPAQAADPCIVSLAVAGGAGGAGVTVGDRVTLAATVSGCTVPHGAYFVVARVKLDSLGRRVGHSHLVGSCAVPCRIHDRHTHAGGYDYQVVLETHAGREIGRSRVVRVVWAGSGGGGNSGSGGGGSGNGGGSGGGSGGSKVTCTLSGTDVQNAQGSALTIDTSGETADYQTPPGGAQSHAHYQWKIPTKLVAGQASSGITIGETISNVQPDQPLSDQINALAPDFANAVQAHYPSQATVSQTFPYTLAADTASGASFDIRIGFVSSYAIYHFHCK